MPRYYPACLDIKRERILHKISDKNKREEIYKILVDSDIIKLIRDDNDKSAKNRIDEIIKQITQESRF